MAPRPFWNAVAPIMAAALIIWARASRSCRRGKGAGQIFLDQPHAFQRDALAHRVVDAASNRPPGNGRRRPCPVPAVMAGGMPTVSSGSAMTTDGSTFGWKITFFDMASARIGQHRRRGRPPIRCRPSSARRRLERSPPHRRGSTNRRYPRNPRPGGSGRP